MVDNRELICYTWEIEVNPCDLVGYMAIKNRDIKGINDHIRDKRGYMKELMGHSRDLPGGFSAVSGTGGAKCAPYRSWRVSCSRRRHCDRPRMQPPRKRAVKKSRRRSACPLQAVIGFAERGRVSMFLTVCRSRALVHPQGYHSLQWVGFLGSRSRAAMLDMACCPFVTVPIHAGIGTLSPQLRHKYQLSQYFRNSVEIQLTKQRWVWYIIDKSCSVDFQSLVCYKKAGNLLKGGVWMPTILDYRRELAWSQRELSRRARLDPNTVRKAENREPVSSQSALAIAEALSKGLGRQVAVREIEGLNVSL
jgi:hypothetical protein